MASESNNQPVRKIGYARVSTADQNPDMQVAELKKHGCPEDLIFVDHASGGTMKRPQLDRAIKYAQHPGTEFVVWKLDRLGRTLEGIIDTMKLLAEREVRFVSLTENIDTKGPMGKAMIHIMAVMAELERDLIAERTRAGIKRARERGESGGRPRSMTPEREAKARELIMAGKRGNAVWLELKDMPGPPIGRAAYYRWQKLWDETYLPDEGGSQ